MEVLVEGADDAVDEAVAVRNDSGVLLTVGEGGAEEHALGIFCAAGVAEVGVITPSDCSFEESGDCVGGSDGLASMLADQLRGRSGGDRHVGGDRVRLLG